MKAPSRNVLFLSFDGLADPLGQAQILPYLTRLADAETGVSVISLEKRTSVASSREAVRAAVAERGLHWAPLEYWTRPPILSALANIRRMQRLASQLHRQRPFDIVHCRSHLAALAAQPLRRRGVRLIFDMRGFWPDGRVAAGQWRLSNPLHRAIFHYFKSKELELVQGSDRVVVLTEAARQEILTWAGCQGMAHRIAVVPCCVDLGHFDRAVVSNGQRRSARERLGLAEGRPTLVYLGSLGSWYMLDEMLQFFRAWLQRHPEAAFLFITPSDPVLVRSRAPALGVPETSLYVTSSSRAQVPTYLSLADVGIFFLRPGYNLKGVSATKTAEFMAMGLPVVCTAGIGDTDQLLEQHGAGVIVDEITEAGFAQAIDQLEANSFDPQDVRKAARAHFDLDDGVRIYRALYSELARSPLSSPIAGTAG